jgi:sugar O-acyltransferase (sialic acid O-acetyltransferase NeuD family)
MKTKLLIFGTGDFAQLANYYFLKEGIYEVVAFVVHRQYLVNNFFEDKPVVAFENLAATHPPAGYTMFIAIGYNGMNAVREKVYHQAREMGYMLANYISPQCTYLSSFKPGDNCFIFEDNTIQPFVKIGSNVIIWSGNHIGHHSQIESHNFITSHVVISGRCIVKSNCFLGVNATVVNNVTIANNCVIGAGAVITSDTEAGGVYVPPKIIKLGKKSSEIFFFKNNG